MYIFINTYTWHKVIHCINTYTYIFTYTLNVYIYFLALCCNYQLLLNFLYWYGFLLRMALIWVCYLPSNGLMLSGLKYSSNLYNQLVTSFENIFEILFRIMLHVQKKVLKIISSYELPPNICFIIYTDF
jgi:hypothetical protein